MKTQSLELLELLQINNSTEHAKTMTHENGKLNIDGKRYVNE
jgi:hypothetical protein